MKKLTILGLIILSACGLIAQADPWSGASPNTQALLVAADQLVAQKKYLSAFQALGRDDSDEYLVAKKVEYCISYFVQSLEHTMFAFKDFEAGDSFDKLRSSGTGTFQMIVYDPAAVIGPLLAASEHRGILYLALGDYYHDVSLRYAGRWIKSDKEIHELAIENYEKAYGLGFYTVDSMVAYAEDLMHAGSFADAIPLFEKALAADPTLYNADFNLAYALQMAKRYRDSIAAGEKAIGKYANDPTYLVDALILCATSEEYLADSDAAIAYLKRCLAVSDRDYRVYQHLGSDYLAQGKVAEADASLDALFALAPQNPAATQMVMRIYGSYGEADSLVAFLKRNIAKYDGQAEILGNLEFHLGVQYESVGNTKEAHASALEAKADFIEAGKYSGDVSGAVEALAARTAPASAQ